ncbi:extensin family protein [Sphingomonas sp. AOB5]|uniref:extensin-like domain-containing protein n=1 Tax=Sphingomonas sp. AOB5 TaxID=3034017 RepID=UPI0023F9F017|nr:extensin family protein [Sphingomonas sp. AOB5]MDF7773754.1 extensin family protein [Sphingomonas sp. AOB5]
MKATRRAIKWTIAVGVLLFGAFLLYAVLRNRPQDLPWTELDLAQPVGLFTAGKIAALREHPGKCEALLDRAGIEYAGQPEIIVEGGQCGYSDGVRFEGGGARRIDLVPARVTTSCPVAAGLALWEWEVVQPAALKHFDKRVSAIEHLGSYNCRQIVGRGEGVWSQHATANALDISAFRLSDARRITVKGDWNSNDPAVRAFLREVRDGACGMFTTVLSPDYNEVHRDHFHFDQGNRGMMGWKACR